MLNVMSIIKIAQFEQASQENMDAIYTRAIKLTRSTPKAEELVQLTFLRAFSTYAKINKKIDFKRWLLGILNDIYNEQCADVEKTVLKSRQKWVVVC